jgi:hypothetical protein
LRGKRHRFLCSEFLSPSVWCEHPWLYHEKLMFRVVDFGTHSLTLETSARNKVLLPGMMLDVFLAIPGQTVLPCKLQVVRVGVVGTERERFRVAAQFVELNEELGRAVASYCLMVQAGISLSDLKEAGYVLDHVGSVAVVDYVHTQEEAESILELRGFSDGFDRLARQVMCKVGGKVVACARVLFHDGRRERSALAAKAVLPAELWREGFLEFSGLVVRDEFVGTDVVDELIRFVLRIAMQSGSRWLVAECPLELVPRCVAMGAEDLKRKVARFQESDDVSYLVRWDATALRAGWGGNAERWAGSFGPLVKHMAQRGSIEVPQRVKVRLALGHYAKTEAGKKLLRKHSTKKSDA